MVAASMECELGAEARNALMWLESLEPPKIQATDINNATVSSIRNKLSNFVPVNDEPLDPEKRSRQSRWFPSIAPKSSRVYYIWQYNDEASKMREKLQQIAENVTYIGSSMSPVRVRITDSYPSPTIEPSPEGDLYLRVPGAGRLRHLEEIYNVRKSTSYVQPRLGRVVPYSPVIKDMEPEISSGMKPLSFFSIVSGNILPEEMGLLSESLRKAIISIYPDPVPPVITGHSKDGHPVSIPHIAITPILDSGRRYSDGHIMGIAVLTPEDMPAFITRELADTCLRIKELVIGVRRIIGLENILPANEEYVPLALRRYTYSKKSTTWATVTPVIFGKHPKKSSNRKTDAVTDEMFRISGLPSPMEFRMGKSPPFRGSLNLRNMYIPSKFAGRLVSHVIVRFPVAVRGPVVLGSGRYLGYGHMRPFPDREVMS